MANLARLERSLRAAGDDFRRAVRLAPADCPAALQAFTRGRRRWRAAARAYSQAPRFNAALDRAHGRALVQAYEAQDILKRCRR